MATSIDQLIDSAKRLAKVAIEERQTQMANALQETLEELSNTLKAKMN